MAEIVKGVAAVGLYFGLLSVSWFVSVVDAFGSGPARNIVVTLILFVASILHFSTTWFHIASFMVEDVDEYEDLGTWLVRSEWFTTAYELVTKTPQQWFFSSQVLCFTVSLALFMFVESHRAQRKFALGAITFGCLGAISAALPLWLMSVIDAPPVFRRTYHRVERNGLVVLSTAVGFTSLLMLPTVPKGQPYILALMLLHIAVVAPLFLAQCARRWCYSSVGDPGCPLRGLEVDLSVSSLELVKDRNVWLVATYSCLATASFFLHLQNLSSSWQGAASTTEWLRRMSEAACANSCQCSISLDLLQISTTVAFYLVCAAEGHRAVRCLLVCLMPLVSVSCIFPMYLCYREVVITPRVSLKDLLMSAGARVLHTPERVGSVSRRSSGASEDVAVALQSPLIVRTTRTGADDEFSVRSRAT
jgi:hypothetical protein